MVQKRTGGSISFLNMKDQDLKDIEELVTETVKPEMEEKENWTSIDAYYRGFHIKKSISTRVSASALKTMIDDLVSQGFEPSWNSETSKAHIQPAVKVSPAPNNNPVCQIHNTPMTWKTGVSKTTGKPYAFWSCSGKMPNGDWCSYKPQ